MNSKINLETIVEEIPYEDPFEAYRRLTRDGSQVSLLMESRSRDLRYGRQSIIVPSPSLKITGMNDRFRLEALDGFGREIMRLIAGIIFLDDSYNYNPDSFRASLDTLKDLKIRERRGVVCGDMLELGESGQRLHREMGAYLAKLLFDFVIAAGPLSKYLVDEAVKNGFDPKRIYHAKDSAEAGRICREMAVPGDRVLVKGSRGMQMEKEIGRAHV